MPDDKPDVTSAPPSLLQQVTGMEKHFLSGRRDRVGGRRCSHCRFGHLPSSAC